MQVLLLIKKASWETRFYNLVFKEWRGQDSNLRPSAPKAHARTSL